MEPRTIRVAPPGSELRLAQPEDLSVPRTGREVRAIIRRLQPRARIAAAVAAFDVSGEAWVEWSSQSTRARLDFPDLPERMGWLLRGWLLGVESPEIVAEMQRRTAEALDYAAERVQLTPGRLAAAWMWALSSAAAITQAFDIGEDTLATDSGQVVAYLTDVQGLTPGDGHMARFAARWWGRFGALWPLARPVWE